MEGNVKSSLTAEVQDLECATSADQKKKGIPEQAGPAAFVNHGAIAWHENRRKWIGDQSRKSRRDSRDPVICWSMTYEDLLLTNEPFEQRIPLAEMVDFLVDIWYDGGLFD
ncbi:hypothetical protein AKJ16_DCAP12492 [Drosera capensis]